MPDRQWMMAGADLRQPSLNYNRFAHIAQEQLDFIYGFPSHQKLAKRPDTFGLEKTPKTGPSMENFGDFRNINPQINLLIAMAKSQDARKETKKKPTKTLKEKRAEKRDKKAGKN